MQTKVQAAEGKDALSQRLARHLEAQALEAGFDLEEYVIRVLERKVGGVNGKEVTDPRTFTSLFSPYFIPDSSDASRNPLSVSGCRQIHRAPGDHPEIGSCRGLDRNFSKLKRVLGRLLCFLGFHAFRALK